jgi:TM2 domain-containing membrane protein YozV
MKDKNVAGILAFFFGIFGVHRFYLGQTGLGILYLVFFWTFIPAIIGFIDALVFLSMGRDDFDYKYNRQKIYPDHRRYDTDFSREDRRRFRDEQRVLREQRRRQQQVRDYSENAQPQRKNTTPPSVRRNNPYKASGIQKYKEYDFEGAIEDFKKALAINPTDIAVHFNLACSYSLNEEKENAFFHLNKAVELGFVDFKKIQDHDALAYLRIQDEFDIFKANGYRLNVAPSPQAPPVMSNPSEQKETTPPGPPEDLLNQSNALLEQIKRLGELREKGLLTDTEFEAQKRKLLD